MFLLSFTGAGLALLLGFLWRDWLPFPWRSADARDNPFPPGALADYVPEDSEAALYVNVRSLRESPVGQQYLTPVLCSIVRQSEGAFPWIELLGAKPLEDVDSLKIFFAPGRDAYPLWLARGRLDPSRFQRGPDKLQPEIVDHFRVWKYTDRQTKQSTLLAPVGDALVACDTPARLRAALHQASQPRTMALRDATLRQQLTEVERGSSVWFAASLKDLGPVARIDHFWLERMLRPIFRYADAVRGHITCTEELRAEMQFHPANEENAAKLEEDLKNLCDVAAGAPLLLGRQKELLPLFRLLASGKTSRVGEFVCLSCRLTAEQLGE